MATGGGVIGRAAAARSTRPAAVLPVRAALISALSPDDPIDVAFESQGVIRDNMVAGDTGIQAFS